MQSGARDHETEPRETGEAPRIPDYELLRLIGRGSFGDVWLARGVTGLFRAVKIVWRDRFAEAGPFEREFRGLAEFAAISLRESIQLGLLHIGKNDAAGFFYYVMELADDVERGQAIDPARYAPLTLSALRRRHGRLSAEECVQFGVELARQLESLHRRGLVHRDIKPSNIILVHGLPKLADIGLVTPTARARTFIGTEGFVPPEGPGSPAADVFALGKVLYELSTGRDHLSFPQLPDDLARLPDARALLRLNRVILRACEPDRASRYRDGAALLADLANLQAGQPLRWPRRAKQVAVGIVVIGICAGVIVTVQRSLQARRRALDPESVPTATAAKAIAVLPFTNLSPDPANAFFADGIHEDVINDLNLIRDFRVVSRTSVMRYRATRKAVRDIGCELGVGYLVEGSVRRDGTRLRLTSRLIESETDRSLWAQTYEREVNDVFTIQAELAHAIASALSTVIEPRTRAVMLRRPTDDLEAYEKFLQGREAADGAQTFRQAEAPLLAAVERDPKFVAAWCALLLVHAQALFHYDYDDPTPERQAKAQAAMSEALALAPDSWEVIRAAGIYQLYVRRDYVRARAQFERLRSMQPNDASVYHWLSITDARQDRLAEALANSRYAVALDPANRRYSVEYQDLLGDVRRWRERLAEEERISKLWPGELNQGDPRLTGALGDRVIIAMTKARIEGTLAPLDELVANCTPEERASVQITSARMELAVARGDLEEFRRLDQSLPPLEFLPRILLASDYFALGDREGAVARLGDVPAQLRARVQSDPQNAWFWLNLGRVEALLGNKDAARAACRKATELIPEVKDPVLGVRHSRSMAVTYAWLGDTDYAIAEIERLLNQAGAHLSGYELRHLTTFFPLRGHPRFEALAHDPKNDQPLL